MVVILIVFYCLISATSVSEQAGKGSGVSGMQVCEQLMEVTAKMTCNQGVEK